MSHGELYAKAEEMIDALFNDNSVPLKTIRSSLTALIKHAVSKLDALGADEAALNPKKRHVRFAPAYEGFLDSAQGEKGSSG